MPAKLSAFVFDCADPVKLADFYQQLTGWRKSDGDEDFRYLGDGKGIQLGFQRVPGYVGPRWPDDANHAHLDLSGVSEQEALKLGATKPEFQPGGENWVVLTDPEGHPFCLT